MGLFTNYFANYALAKKRSQDEQYMQLAIKSAEMSKSNGEAARGAVLVFPNSHFVEGQTVFADHNPIAHAEMNVLHKACHSTNKSFKDAVLYTTTEPCPLCVCAMYEYGVRELVFGAYDDANGFINSNRKLVLDHFNISYIGGILAKECCEIASISLRENLRYQ